MKKTILLILMVLLYASGNGFAIDRSKYEPSQHKFRNQFKDNEWREHQERHERYFRDRHQEDYFYREQQYRYNNGLDDDNYNDSMRFEYPYGHGYRNDSHGNDWNKHRYDQRYNDTYYYDFYDDEDYKDDGEEYEDYMESLDEFD
jgi:hypothetical protein